MKTCLRFPMYLILLILTYTGLKAQEFPNPFIDNKNTFNQEDILILYNEAESNVITQQVYGYDWIRHNSGNIDDLVVPLTDPANLENMDLGSGQYLNVVSGHFNEDRSDDMVYIIERESEIDVGIHTMYTEFVDTDTSFLYELNEPETYVSVPISAFTGAPKVATGDFDGDGTDEVAVAWREASGDLVKIQVFDTDNSETLVKRALSDDQTSLRINAYNAFDLGSGDLNGDGADEILLTGLEESGSGNADYQVFVQVFEVNSTGSGEITPRAHMVIDDEHLADYNSGENMLGYAQTVVTGFNTNTNPKENRKEDVFASFAFVYYGDPQFEYDNFFQFLLRANGDLSTLSVLDTLTSYLSSAGFKVDYPLEAKTGDVNGDDVEDVVLLTSGGKIYTSENDQLFFKGNSGGIVLDESQSGVTESVDRLEVGDVDRDGRDEIITFSKGIGDNDENNFFINVSGVLDDFSTDTLAGGSYSFTDLSNSNTRSYAISAGNLDGNDLHFGEPNVLSCEYMQPVFIIGAIPSHFDILDNMPYDINNCYPVQDCDLQVQITSTESSSTNTDVNISSDWAVSVDQTAKEDEDFAVKAYRWAFNIAESVKGKYGAKFEDVNSDTHSQTVSLSITATADDMIQYLKIPITLYQYPVLDDAGDTTCFFLAAFPEDDLSPQTIVANGKSVFNYTPDYEVGNILSYPTINSDYSHVIDLPRTAGDWIIYDNAPNYSMAPSGAIEYTISNSENHIWETSTDAYAALDVKSSDMGFGMGLPENQNGLNYLEAANLPTDYPPNSVEANFLTLYSNSITTETEFNIRPTNITGAPNEFNYLISPRIYWNYDGSGVVRFEVDIDHQVGSGSFWATSAYTEKSDPALNLPYRYDQVHNPDLSNTENLDRTKSVWFSSNLPQQGDTVSMFVRIFNYSFVGTGGPIEFKIYHEDPDNGGTVIPDIYGNTLFETESGLGDRGRDVTEIKFKATADLITDDFTKIYVVLDPNNLIDEIHEENNKGWTLFGYACNEPGNNFIPSSLQPEISSENQYLNIYPNPANEQVIIEHNLRSVQNDHPMLIISSIMGVRIARFYLDAGFEGKVYWNTNAVAPGIYIVYLVSDKGFLDSKKIMVM